LLDRHAAAWRTRVRPAARVAFWGALFASVVAAGALARRGTLEARLFAFALIVVVVLAFVVRALLERRSLLRRDRIVRRLVLREARRLGEKVLRALDLKERADRDPSVGSVELAGVHLERTVARIPERLVIRRSERLARRFRAAAFALSLLGLVGVAIDPP